MGTASSSPANIGSGGVGQLPLDSNMQQNLQQGAGGNYNAIFGMNSMNSYGTGASNSTGNSASGSSGFVQDTGNPNTNRALLEMSFPYQQYGSYAGMFGNNAQAMIMAQAALRGNPASYLGFTGQCRLFDVRVYFDLISYFLRFWVLLDQQPPLSQLASLAGSQNSAGNFGQSPVSMGIGLGFGGTGSMGGMSGIGGMNSMGGIGGMGGVMNDNSNNRLGSDGMMNNAF